MPHLATLLIFLAATAYSGCIEKPADPAKTSGKNSSTTTKAGGAKAPKAEGDWSVGDTIPSGRAGVPAIKILKVHKNGSGPVCGNGKTASLRYKAMLANGTVVDPGTNPFTFQVGGGRAIKGWDVVVARMRVGDSFTILLPQQLAYGPSRGDFKFDMELLSAR